MWGPFLWAYLHIMARHYPEEPTDTEQNHMRAFLLSFPATLPCAQCRRHALAYMHENADAVARSVLSQRALMNLLWRMHNAVNARTGKRPLNWDQVKNLYDARQVQRH